MGADHHAAIAPQVAAMVNRHDVATALQQCCMWRVKPRRLTVAAVLVAAGPIAAVQRTIQTDLESPKPFLDRIVRDATRLVLPDTVILLRCEAPRWRVITSWEHPPELFDRLKPRAA